MSKPGERIAVIPLCRHPRSLKWCLVLITSRDSGDWILPTGRREKNHSDHQVAHIEAFEEAGIDGILIDDKSQSLTVHRYRGKQAWELSLFVMHVKHMRKQWPESQERKRQLVRPKQLNKYVRDKGLRKLLSDILEQAETGKLPIKDA